MSNSSATWTPTKPANAYSEDEVREGPDFQTLRGAMPSVVTDEKVLELARQAIEARWVTIRDSRRDELVGEFVENLLICDPELEKVNQIVITRDDEGGLGVEFKRARAPRWSEDTYALNLGTFTKEYRSERHPEASGEYKLEIQKGRNENERVFMRVTEPSGRVLAYPPVNAEAPVGRLQNGDVDPNAKLVECSSISRLLRDSTHKTTLSVWQYFNLKRGDEDESESSES